MWSRDNDRYRTFTRRAVLLGGGKLALLSALIGRMYYLQVMQAQQYSMLAEENRINMRLLTPLRGRILDRQGIELASNRLNYRVVLIPEQAVSIEETLSRLADLLHVTELDRARVLKEVKRKRSFVPIPVVEHLTWEEFARVNVYSPDLPGIQLEVGETRDYPYGAVLAHMVGYVGAVSEKELSGSEDPLLELPDFRIGKNGLEKTYDLQLRGKAGNSRVEVNAFGRVIRELTRKDGQPGDDLVLTTDAGLQEYVAKRLEGESAAAVVLDIHTGDVLAFASMPGYDPNAFNVGLTQEYWNELRKDKKNPLVSKNVSGQYPPGSTFKMVVALAALEAGVVGPDYTVFCRGEVQVGTHTFHCWKKGGHGSVDMLNAIQKSCDIYFYDIARKVGIDRISDMAMRFGLGRPTGIDLPNERAGLIPTKEWKQARFGSAWQQGDTVNAGIGQGYVLATPLQLAIMVARIANGGYAVTPHLAHAASTAAAQPASMGLPAAALKLVKAGMEQVVNNPRGTAYGARIKDPEMAMAGKTGSAQVRRISKAERRLRVRKNEEKPWEERDHALFVAFAPVSAPRYAVAVVIEHGGGGSVAAAPVARDILIETQKRDPARKPPIARIAGVPLKGEG